VLWNSVRLHWKSEPKFILGSGQTSLGDGVRRFTPETITCLTAAVGSTVRLGIAPTPAHERRLLGSTRLGRNNRAETEIVEPAQVSVTALADHFGVSRQALSTLLNGNANLSADMAIRFEKAFGIKADTLLRMQTTYDLAQAREHEQDIKVQKFARAA